MNTMEETREETMYLGAGCSCKSRDYVSHWSEDIEPCYYCEQMRYFRECETELHNICKMMANIGYNVGTEISEELDIIFDVMVDIKRKLEN